MVRPIRKIIEEGPRHQGGFYRLPPEMIVDALPRNGLNAVAELRKILRSASRCHRRHRTVFNEKGRMCRISAHRTPCFRIVHFGAFKSTTPLTRARVRARVRARFAFGPGFLAKFSRARARARARVGPSG